MNQWRSGFKPTHTTVSNTCPGGKKFQASNPLVPFWHPSYSYEYMNCAQLVGGSDSKEEDWSPTLDTKAEKLKLLTQLPVLFRASVSLQLQLLLVEITFTKITKFTVTTIFSNYYY